MNGVFVDLAMVLGLAAVLGVVAKILKQPVIIGYIVAGILLGSSEVMELMGRLGVTFLLFLAGMELSLTELRKMGKPSVITGLSQILIVSGLGTVICFILGFSYIEAIYLGLGLAFGSTIVVIKLLSERGDIQSLQGKITVGYLLVQDFVAIGLMVVLSGSNGGMVDLWSLGFLALKGILMVAVAIFLAEKVMAKAVDFLAGSTELLFLTSIGWCLLIAAIVASPLIGFSIEIGGFLAGLTLAKATEQTQIISRIRPLRDFFLTWFFVTLGASVNLASISQDLFISLGLGIFVILVTPATVFLVLTSLGYHKRTAFLAGISVGQISEFSLILAAGGIRTGVISDRILLILTLTALITMTSSTYMINNGQKLYAIFAKYLKSGKRLDENKNNEDELQGHALLFGHNRTGSRIRPVLEKLGFKVLVIDFNPEIVEKLKFEGRKVVYGDMSDYDLYESIGLSKAVLIISTIPDLFDNLNLLHGVLKHKGRKKQTVILTANDEKDAKTLYKEGGVDYVLVPNQVGGDFLAGLIEKSVKADKIEL